MFKTRAYTCTYVHSYMRIFICTCFTSNQHFCFVNFVLMFKRRVKLYYGFSLQKKKEKSSHQFIFIFMFSFSNHISCCHTQIFVYSSMLTKKKVKNNNRKMVKNNNNNHVSHASYIHMYISCRKQNPL